MEKQKYNLYILDDLNPSVLNLYIEVLSFKTKKQIKKYIEKNDIYDYQIEKV